MGKQKTPLRGVFGLACACSPWEGSGDTEPEVGDPAEGVAPVAARGTKVKSIVEKRPAAKDAEATVSCLPCTAIRRCCPVINIPTILDPFPDVADHIMEAKYVWRIATYIDRVLLPPSIPVPPSILGLSERY